MRDDDHVVIATKITRCQSISFRHLHFINLGLEEKIIDNHCYFKVVYFSFIRLELNNNHVKLISACKIPFQQ